MSSLSYLSFNPIDYTLKASVAGQSAGLGLKVASPEAGSIAVTASYAGLSGEGTKSTLLSLERTNQNLKLSVNAGTQTSKFDPQSSSTTVSGTPVTPESRSGMTTRSPTTMSFPLNRSEKYFISFSFKETTRKSITSPLQEDYKTIIYLPMPSALVERFSMSYATRSPGTTYGIVEGETGVASTLGAIFTSAQNAQQEISKSAGDIKNLVDRGTTLSTLVRAGITSIMPVGGAIYDKVTGTALNPYTSLFFEGPDLRTHSFNFRLSPNNEAESYEVKRIVNHFKYRMHPEHDGLLLNYPDICQITISAGAGKNDVVYEVYECFLKNMTVNYAPQGSPSFFSDGAPAEVELTLDFGEIEMITRNILRGEPPPKTSNRQQSTDSTRSGFPGYR